MTSFRNGSGMAGVPIRGNLHLFCSTPADVQWPELAVGADAVREEVALLFNACAVDSALHWSSSLGVHAILHTTSMCPLDGLLPLPESIQVLSQPFLPLHQRIAEAYKSSEVNETGNPTILVTGKSPLYPVDSLRRGVELLGQEDEVVTLGEGYPDGGGQCLMWVAAKGPHPEIAQHFENQNDPQMNFLELAADAHGLVMVLKPEQEIGGMLALSHLLHDIERELLLKQWYPAHTHAILMRLQNQGAIPEVHT